MESYELRLNAMQKALLDHAIQFCIDSQDEMVAITPNMAADLDKIRKKIKERGERSVRVQD